MCAKNGAYVRVSLVEQIREDWIANHRDWTRPGFRAIAIHRFGNWRMTLRPRILRGPFTILYKYLFRYVRNHYGIELACRARIGRRVVIEHQSGIVVHYNAVIGNDCVIRQNVTIGVRTTEDQQSVPAIGDRVNIGAGAVLIGKIVVGDDAVIGANAVITRDVPPGCVAVGVPARIIARAEVA